MAGEYEIDFRAHPGAYRYQSGEQGVFKVQPYKDELLPEWRFKNESVAEESVEALRETYQAYRTQEDFVGMDMVRKYLQMGYTRAMRYAKHPGGQSTTTAPNVFRDTWQSLTNDPAYQRLKARHQNEVYDPDASPMVD